MLQYQAPHDLLKAHIILVSGAGQGLGLQAAISFAQHGATVILVGRKQEKLEAVEREARMLKEQAQKEKMQQTTLQKRFPQAVYCSLKRIFF